MTRVWGLGFELGGIGCWVYAWSSHRISTPAADAVRRACVLRSFDMYDHSHGILWLVSLVLPTVLRTSKPEPLMNSDTES